MSEYIKIPPIKKIGTAIEKINAGEHRKNDALLCVILLYVRTEPFIQFRRIFRYSTELRNYKV